MSKNRWAKRWKKQVLNATTVAYTEYVPRAISTARKFGVATVGDALDVVHKIAYKEQDDDRRAEYIVFGNVLEMDRRWIENGGTNIFMPDIDFCNWLVGCVRSTEQMHLQILSDHVGKSPACLHFPTSSKLASILFWLAPVVHEMRAESLRDISDEDHLVLVGTTSHNCQNDELREMCFCRFFADSKDSRVEPHGRPEELIMWYIKLLVGIGMYVSCFPEQVLPGLPQAMRNTQQYQGKAVQTIGIAPKVRQGGTHDSPYPHPRTHYFKTLRSPRFTKKRWQIVYVRDTFVKGRAETVASVDDPAAPANDTAAAS